MERVNILRSTSKLSTVALLSRIASFLAILYFARTLGAQQLGIYFLFESLVHIFRIPADLGLSGAVEKRISEGDDPGRFVSSGIVLKLIPLLLISSVVFVGSPYVNEYLNAEFSHLVVLCLFLREYALLSLFVLKGELRVGVTAELRLVQKVIWIVVSVTLQRHTTLQSLALVYGLIASFAVVLFLGWARTATSFESPSTEHASSLWEYGRFNLFSNVSAVGYEWIDVTYIGVLIGPAAVGVYEMAWRITSILLLFTNSFADTIIPQVSKWHSTGAVERIQSFVTTGIIVALLVPLPGFLGIVLLSNPLLGTIFGEQYTAASMALVILAGGRCIESINKVVGRTLHGLDYPRIGAEISVVILVLNVVMNSVLVWRFGISGAAIGTVLSFSVGAGIAIYKLNHIIEFDFPWRFAVSLVIPLSIMALLIKVLQLYIDTSSLIGLVSLVAAGAVVYTLSLMAIPGPRLSLKQSLKTLQ